jgi:hypothetical protein
MPTLSFSNTQVQSALNLTTLTSTSFTPATGDIIVVKAISADSGTPPGTPTGGGWTYTQRVGDATASHTNVHIWTAPVTLGGTAQTIAISWSGTTNWHSMVVEVWSNAALAGSPATANTRGGPSAPSTTITTTAANSVVTWCNGDWSAVSPAGRTYNTTSATPSEELVHDGSTTNYVAYYAYQTAGAAGSQTFGITAPSTQTWTLAAVEILDAPSGGTSPEQLWMPGFMTGGGFPQFMNNARGAVGWSPTALPYDVGIDTGPALTSVTSSRSTSWDTLASTTPATRATTWTTLASVTPSTRATTWNTLASVAASTWATTWATLAQVAASTRATTWNTYQAVTATRATTWNTLASVLATRATTWATLASVAATRATTWNTLATVAASTRQTTWNVAANLTSVTSTRATTWNTLATVTASTRATTWNTAASVTSTRATSWTTLQVVTSTRATTWATRAAVTATRPTSWATLASVAATRATTWNVAGSLTSVTSTRATTWTTLAPVTATRATTWTVRASIGSTRATTWNVYTSATAIRGTSWATLAQVAASSRATSWRTLQSVLATRTTTWSVAALFIPLDPAPPDRTIVVAARGRVIIIDTSRTIPATPHGRRILVDTTRTVPVPARTRRIEAP